MTYYLVLPFTLAKIVNGKGEILMGKHADLPRKPFPGYWDMPGGKLFEDESLEENVKREAKE